MTLGKLTFRSEGINPIQFQTLENASPLEIRYEGERLDLYTMGLFQLQLQDVVDKVALGLLSQAGLLEPTWRRAKHLPRQQLSLIHISEPTRPY